MTRSVFFKNENYTDVQTALNQADTELERKRLVWNRMKQNGCTQESEVRFRHHCQVCGFILPGETGKANPLGKDSSGRTQARLLADEIRKQNGQSQVLKTD